MGKVLPQIILRAQGLKEQPRWDGQNKKWSKAIKYRQQLPQLYLSGEWDSIPRKYSESSGCSSTPSWVSVIGYSISLKKAADGLQFDPAQPLLFNLSQTNLCSLPSTGVPGFWTTSVRTWYPHTTQASSKLLRTRKITQSLFSSFRNAWQECFCTGRKCYKSSTGWGTLDQC